MSRLFWPAFYTLIGLFILPLAANAQHVVQPEMPVILSMEDRATVVNEWLMDRLETVVPDLMRRNGIDMWIVVAREYNDMLARDSFVQQP